MVVGTIDLMHASLLLRKFLSNFLVHEVHDILKLSRQLDIHGYLLDNFCRQYLEESVFVCSRGVRSTFMTHKPICH